MTGPTGCDLLRVLESDTDTITDAVTSGRVTLDDLDRFVQGIQRGEVAVEASVESVIRIVRSLLGDDDLGWEEMAAAGHTAGHAAGA